MSGAPGAVHRLRAGLPRNRGGYQGDSNGQDDQPDRPAASRRAWASRSICSALHTKRKPPDSLPAKPIRLRTRAGSLSAIVGV